MKPYNKYKLIAFEYIKQIPKDWEFLPNIALFNERVQKGFVNEELLAVSIKKGVTKTDEIVKKDSSNEDKNNYKLLKIGDIAYNPMRMWQGALGYSQLQGIVSPAYVVLKPKTKINSRYFHYLYRTSSYIKYSKQHSYGLCDDMLKLRYTQFKRMYSFVPPLETQNQIVTYLQQKEQQIKTFVAKKKLLIEKLEEQIYIEVFGKKLIASNEWEMFFNKDWSLEKAKWLFKERNIRNYPNEKLLASTQDRGLVFKDEIEENYVTANQTESLKLVCKKDFVISLRSFEGGIELSEVKGITSPAYNIFYLNGLNKQNNLEYYYKYLFKTKQFIDLLNTVVSGIREGKNISFNDFRELLIPIPDNQTVDKIFKLHQSLIKAKISINKEIQLAEQLLQSTIEQMVTGKVAVPKAIAKKATSIKEVKENWAFKEGVLIALLTDKFGSKEYPLGRKRYTKLSYLFHRKYDNDIVRDKEKAAEPYNPSTKYGDPEKIILQNNYVVKHNKGKNEGFIAAEKIAEAYTYGNSYWDNQLFEWLNTHFKYKTNDELELYAAVDKAMIELEKDKKNIATENIKHYIKNSDEWKAKLKRAIFNDENINNAITFLNKVL